MATLIFTICARNYIGLAQVLGRSIIARDGEVDFRIYVAEGIDEETRENTALVSAPAALSAYIPPVEYANMALMYDVTEFCTSLKAACFLHAFAEGYDRCIYMDPDTFLVADVAHITRALDATSILLTPHLCLAAEGEGPRADNGILATGIYNLGFLGVRRGPETEPFLRWWHARLRRQAFNDHYQSLYTDQRWMDFVPSLFSEESVCVWRHLGCNVAPWNFHERRIVAVGEEYAVESRHADHAGTDQVPLVFLHFSGFDFRRILDGRFDQLNLADAEDHADLAPLYERYAAAIGVEADAMERYLAQPYGYARFDDGTLVLPSHRRLFRVWRERHGDALEPFATGPGTFHAALTARGLIGRGSSGDLAREKATVRSVAHPDRLLARARLAFGTLFRLLGAGRFFFFVRSLNRLSHVEQHYDTFRLDEARVTTAADAARC